MPDNDFFLPQWVYQFIAATSFLDTNDSFFLETLRFELEINKFLAIHISKPRYMKFIDIDA